MASDDEAPLSDCLTLPADPLSRSEATVATADPVVDAAGASGALSSSPQPASQPGPNLDSDLPVTASETLGHTTTATKGAAGTASSSSRATRKVPRAPPTATPELPATATQVVDLASLSSVVTALSATIIKAVQDGKSVTASNKRLILAATEETRRAMAAFQRLAATTHTPPTSMPNTLAPPPSAAGASDADSLRRDIVHCVREEMVKLKGELISSVSDAARPSYAQMLASKPAPSTTATSPGVRHAPPSSPLPASRPAIVVSTKLPVKTRQEAVTAWRNSISFRDSTYAPVKIQPISNNKLRVEFETGSHRDDALARLRGSDKVSAEPARKLQPMLIVKGITRDTHSEELVNIIKCQNPALGVSEAGTEIQLKFMRRNRNENLYNAVLVATPKAWRKAVELGRLNIDHQRVHVEDFSPFMQCRACLQFGHGQKHCASPAKRPCAFCADTGHEEADCPAKANKQAPKCFNCAKRNANFNLKKTTDHPATSNSCPVLRDMKARVDQRIDYGF